MGRTLPSTSLRAGSVRRFWLCVFSGRKKSHQNPKQIKVRDSSLHSGISHPVSPKDGETRVGHPGWCGQLVWVGHSLRLRSGQALCDAFDFVFLMAGRSRTKFQNKSKSETVHFIPALPPCLSKKRRDEGGAPGMVYDGHGLGNLKSCTASPRRPRPSVTCLICRCWIRSLQVDLEVEY